MVEVVGVRFRTAGKVYFFDPKKFDIKQGDHVIVETARGVEYGRVVTDKKKVDKEAVSDELKPVLRIATREDKDAALENLKKEKEAFSNLFTENPGAQTGDETGSYRDKRSTTIKSCFTLPRTAVWIFVNW